MLYKHAEKLRAAARRAAVLPGVLVFAIAAQGPAPAAEAPPPQGTRLHFERTLSVHRSTTGKVFAETRQLAPGETLRQILTRNYGIAEGALPAFFEAFRSVNPGLDPDHLTPGQVIRVPFKVEETLAPSAAPSQPTTYAVRSGDNLWKILKGHYGVPRERMGEALKAFARANPQIADLDRLLVGQRLAIPPELAAPPPAARPPPQPPPGSYQTVLGLLKELGCQVSDTGEIYLPMGRGRTVRFEARDFPLLTGPAGERIILDPAQRMSPALARSVQEGWRYRVVSGIDPDPESQLARLLPHLGFHEVSEGTRSFSLGWGVELLALPRWTVIPRPEDLWEGEVHLLFSGDGVLDPGLAAAAKKAGFALHILGSTDTQDPRSDPPPPAEIPMGDPAVGLSRLLGHLGVAHRLRPEIECELGRGVRYRLHPELTFRHAGTEYAVPPSQPPRAESFLFRAGYFTVSWPADASPLNRLGDVLALLGVPHARTTVEVPQGQALRLRATGIEIDEPALIDSVYPSAASGGSPGRIFLTEARLSRLTAHALFQQGLLPWVVRTD